MMTAIRIARLSAAMVLAHLAILSMPGHAKAQRPVSIALSGRVSSRQEEQMEGVLVSAKRNNSTVTVTVVTDAQGRYRFTQNRLEPGTYRLNVRAVGYEMNPVTVEVISHTATTANLQLQQTHDLAAQLTNAEWLLSIPPQERKNVLLDCTMCHTLQRIVHSNHDAGEFTRVMQRMSGYYDGSTPLLPQLVPAFVRNPGDPERFRQSAEFLSTINLSKVSRWAYSLKTFPRPTGRSTRVVITEYDLPRRVSQPHDVILDSEGFAWYMDFGQPFIGKLDPRTGQVVEFPMPVLKAGQPRGGIEVEPDKAGNLWLGMQFQAAIAKFDKKAQTFQVFALPQELNTDVSQISMVSPTYSHVDGKVWMKDRGSANQIKRVDIATGKFDIVQPFPKGYSAYGISADTKNNCYFMDLRGEDIGRVNAETLQVKFYKTPTRDSGPRRGHTDSQDRLWFAEYRGNKVAMFDPRTDKFQEWALPTPWTNPYDAVLDTHDELWTGGMSSDRIVRVNTKTGQTTEYLLPQETNIRRVFVDNSTNPVTFWAGNDHHASIIKLEPLD